MQTRYPFHLHTGTAVAVAPLMRDMEVLLRELSTPVARQASPRPRVPPADVLESDAGLTLRVDLPGHDANAIEVKVENDVLTVRSERKDEPEVEGVRSHRLERDFGVYARAFSLPRTVDASRVEARYDKGVLTLTLPRREETRARVIQVKTQQ